MNNPDNWDLMDSLKRIEDRKKVIDSLPWEVMGSDNATPHIMRKGAMDIDELDKLICRMPAEITQSFNSWANANFIVEACNKYKSAALAPKPEAKTSTLEPLAVLAVNKGCQVAWIGTYKSNPLMWSIEVQNAKKTEVFNAPTYAACEQLARTWLEEQKEGKV